MPAVRTWLDEFAASVMATAVEFCERERLIAEASPHLMFLRGLLASASARPHAAIAYLREACLASPAPLEYLTELARALEAVGRKQEALSAFLSCMVRTPTSDVLFRDIARILMHLGRRREAVVAYLEAVRLTPAVHAELHAELSEAWLSIGAVTAAAQHAEQALCLAPGEHANYDRLGRIHLASDALAEALDTVERGLERCGDHAMLHARRGEALFRLGRLSESLEAYETAVILDPSHLDALEGYAGTLLAARGPGASGAWTAFGRALDSARNFDSAANAFRQAIEVSPDSLDAHLGLSHACLALGQPASARDHLTMIVSRAPEHTRAHISLGLASYETGEHDAAWREFCWCYHPREATESRRFEGARWKGAPLNGKRLLVWTAQGFGDTVLFLRCLQSIKSMGAYVIVECHDRGLLPLIANAPYVDEAVLYGMPLPAYDFHAPLVYLPGLLSNPSVVLNGPVPYVTVPREMIESWRARLGPSSRPRVGICWGGNREHRSAASRFVPLRRFMPLTKAADVRLVSLQLGVAADEVLTHSGEVTIDCPLNRTHTLLDTAALILNLDLIITVDTVIPHLAGALGMPVWTLLRYAPSWRWWGDPDRVWWFPTMRLFRQTRLDDWSDVFARVQEALRTHCWAVRTS